MSPILQLLNGMGSVLDIAPSPIDSEPAREAIAQSLERSFIHDDAEALRHDLKMIGGDLYAALGRLQAACPEAGVNVGA